MLEHHGNLKNDRTHHKVTCVRYIWSPSGLFFKCSGPQVQVWSCSIMNPTAPWNWLKDDGFLLGSKRLFCLQGSFFAVRFSFFLMLAGGNYGWISVSGFHVSSMLLHFEALDFLSLKSWNTPTPKPMGLTSRGFTPAAEMKECHPGPGTIFPVESFFRGFRVNKIHHRKMGCLRCALKTSSRIFVPEKHCGVSILGWYLYPPANGYVSHLGKSSGPSNLERRYL